MAPPWLAACLVGFLALLSPRLPVAQAQYNQDYRRVKGTGSSPDTFLYLPTSDQRVLEQVVDLASGESTGYFVLLVYNCHYMIEICKNADNWFSVNRATMHSSSKLPHRDSTFGWDFDTGTRKNRGNNRKHQRRKESCPSNWKDTPNDRCPEAGQEKPYRHDKQWHTTAVDPNWKHINKLAPLVKVSSGIRYTCDEFPAAPWVEGGTGFSSSASKATTRCAAMRCQAKHKAEQDWQGTAHNILQQQLKRLAKQEKALDPNGPFGKFEDKRSVALFRFTQDKPGVADGIAARVWTIADNGVMNTNLKNSTIKQGLKRRQAILARDILAAANASLAPGEPLPPYEVLKQLIDLGFGTEQAVLANQTEPSAWERSGSPGFHAYDSDDHGDAALSNDAAATAAVVGLGARWDLNLQGSCHNASSASAYHQADRRSPVPPRLGAAAASPLWRRNLTDPSVLPHNASLADLDTARALIRDAIAESGRLNKARVANPLRNHYELRPGTVIGAPGPLGRRARPGPVIEHPLLKITDEIARAAALVAQADAMTSAGVGFSNQTLTRRQSGGGSGTYWMQHLARKGRVPWGSDPSYTVFRNVRDYGAVGDGITDDTEAIKFALLDGQRCAANCNGATTKNAIVYLPPGTYLISSAVPLPFGTQLIGDAVNRPVLRAATSFTGFGVVSVNEYTGGGTGTDGLEQQWYVNTANFYRQLRNLVIDVRSAPAAETPVAALHYQVAQATSTQNVELIAGPGQIGMFAENGSGGQISDMTFTGGAYGIYGGSQQFTAQRLVFQGCDVGVRTIWDWGWVWKSITMTNVGVGFKLVPEGTAGNVGSAAVMDSSFTNVNTVIMMTPPTSTPGTGTTGLLLERVALSGVTNAIADDNNAVLLSGTAAGPLIDHWTLGPVYSGSSTSRSFSMGGKIGNYRRDPSLLDTSGAYFERPKPQYEGLTAANFAHARDYGATGDGVTDDTAALQRAVYESLAAGKVLFIDAGNYILTSTIQIPPGSRIVGEAWSQLVAVGPYFSDAANPKVLIRVAEVGQTGDVEMQDLMFTTRGPTAGAVLVEWNIKASSPGSAALWDCHVRIGGATGTELTPAECPAVRSGIAGPNCNAASLMMHVTKSASGYFENMWLWVADHMIDDPDLIDANNTMVQCSIYVARGLLVESKHATWLYGTSSEHAVFYQYNFHQASHIFAGMIQTESPYYQPTPPPPAPFAANVGVFTGDPSYDCVANNEFSGCDESWAVIMRGCSNILVASAGLYSWFSTYEQTCIGGQLCQKALVLLDGNHASVRFQHLITIGAKYMAVMDGVGIEATDNLNVDAHPFWSQISILDVASDGSQFDDVLWIDPVIWGMAQPQFNCHPPCTVRLPPWKGATSTIDYPRMTVSSGAWTSVLFRAPLTVSVWILETETITAPPGGPNKRAPMHSHTKRQAAVQTVEVYPTLAQTPTWPVVVYEGPDGVMSTASPTEPMPTPPAITPGAPAPLIGSWPSVAILAALDPNLAEMPLVGVCDTEYFDCPHNQPATGLDLGNDDEDPDYDENWEDLQVVCPETTTTSVAPARVTAHPMQNSVACIDQGKKVTNSLLVNAIKTFCIGFGGPGVRYFGSKRVGLNAMKRDTQETVMLESGSWLHSAKQEVPGQVEVDIGLEVFAGCEWEYDEEECKRYLGVAVNSCDCSGVDGKQGGVVKNDCLLWWVDPNVKL